VRLKVLGPHGGELRGCRSTCFLVDDTLAIDAGALTGALDIDELVAVDDVLLTHSHFDHLKDLPMLSDVLVGRRRRPVVIHGGVRCIDALKRHVFNEELWPDFTSIPTRRQPLYKLRAFRPGARVTVGRHKVKSVLVSHTVETCGFVVTSGDSALGISGDTGPTEDLWKVLRATKELKLVLVECSFPNELQALADISGHLTPRTLEGELAKLGRPDVDVLLYHLKPTHREQLKREVAHLDVHVLELDEEYEL
jgi:cAMP phosphodiesterase